MKIINYKNIISSEGIVFKQDMYYMGGGTTEYRIKDKSGEIYRPINLNTKYKIDKLGVKYKMKLIGGTNMGTWTKIQDIKIVEIEAN